MISFSRRNQNILSNWWWTVDKVLLLLIFSLLVIGAFLNFSASPAVATRIGFDSFHFIRKQIFFIPVALGLMIFLSMQNLRTIRRIAILGYMVFMALLIATLFWAEETKGASRWIRVVGFSLQPSEFVKTFFIVVTAWLFDGQKKYQEFPGNIIAMILLALTVGLLLKQPDLGMTIVVFLIWAFQFFLSGLSLMFVTIMGGVCILLLIGAYLTLGHVRDRVQQFLESENNLSFQIKKSLDAFANGNIFGKGPGEGVVKLHLPDAHTDFIFSVAGEEVGVILCLIIVAIFASIVVRAMLISMKDNSLFIILSGSALAASLGLQSIINMASSMHLIPTKGMTLPFISYGGSSLLACAFNAGMLLAITRRNANAEDKDYV